MNQSESNQVAYYAGIIKGLATTILYDPNDKEDTGRVLVEQLNDISMDLRVLADGADEVKETK